MFTVICRNNKCISINSSPGLNLFLSFLCPRMEVSMSVNGMYLHELHGNFIGLPVGVRGLE